MTVVFFILNDLFMIKLITFLNRTFVFFVLTVSFSFTFANERNKSKNESFVSSDFLLSVQNQKQTAANVWEFDIYMQNTRVSPLTFEVGTLQFGFLFNSSIYTGGSISVVINNTGSGLVTGQQFLPMAAKNLVGTLAGYPNLTLFRMAGRTPVGTGYGSLISSVYPGSLVTHVIFTNTIPFVANTTPNLTFNSSTVGLPLYVTSTSEYLNNVNTLLSVTSGLDAIVIGNPVFNETTPNNWIGSNGTDWKTPANWSGNKVPGKDDNISISDGASNDCKLDADHSVSNITITNSSYRLLTNGYNLTIIGSFNFTNGGQIDASSTGSTITFSGTTSQTIPYGAFLNNSIYNLAINNTGNVILNGTLKLLNSISQSIGQLDANTNKPNLIYSGSSVQSLDSIPFLKGLINNLTIDNSLVTLNANLTVNSLTINSGKTLVISPSNQLNVTGTITNNGGNSGLIIKAGSTPTTPNGSLIFHNPGNSPVQGTVEMYSIANWTTTNGVRSNYKWEFFGIPVQSVTASPTFNGAYVRQHNEAGMGSGYDSSNRWIQMVESSTLTPFTGYEIVQSEAKTYSFTGNLVNSDFHVSPLSYTTLPAVTYPGQHLFSNPYTAAINISKLTLGSSTDGTIYLYNTGSYNDWYLKGQGASSGNSPGQYTSIPVNASNGINGIPNQIPSMQGFLIMATDGTSNAAINIPYSAVTKNTVPLKTSGMINTKTSDSKVYTIIVVNGKQFADRMWLITDSTCSHSFDFGWDGAKLIGSPIEPQLYAMETDGMYQVNTVDDVNNTYLGFKPGIDSTYTLTFTHFNTDQRYRNIYLLDIPENKTVDITSTASEYSFTTSSTAPVEKRFKIIAIGNENEIATGIVDRNHSLTVFSSGKTIFVNNQSGETGTLYLYDMTGRSIQKMAFTSNKITTFSIHLPSGTYLSKAVTSHGQLTTKLIL